jgi:hypothetical protein
VRFDSYQMQTEPWRYHIDKTPGVKYNFVTLSGLCVSTWRVSSLRKIGSGIVRRLKSDWWVPVLILLLLGVLAPANFGTSSPHLSITDISAREPGPPGDSPTRLAKRLPVPYADQGTTKWCFEASLSMVLQYYGDPVRPGDIADALGIGPDESTSFLDIFFGSIESYLSGRPGLDFRQHIGNWGFERYAELIDNDTPVIVSTFGLPGHTLVVTGYAVEDDGAYLYVNDPSGYYSKLAWKGDRNRAARVSWSQFSRNLWSEMIIVRDAGQKQ